MVGTIAPVVYGKDKKLQYLHWFFAISLYVLSAVGAAVLTGGIVGVISASTIANFVPSIWASFILSITSALFALHELGLIHLPKPQWKRQVQSKWRGIATSPIVIIFYGSQLGAGYATYVTVMSLYAITIAIILTGSPILGIILFGSFGLSRSVLLVPLAWTVRNYRQVERVNALIGSVKVLVHLFNGWILALVSGYFLNAFLIGKGLAF